MSVSIKYQTPKWKYLSTKNSSASSISDALKRAFGTHFPIRLCNVDYEKFSGLVACFPELEPIAIELLDGEVSIDCEH